MSSIMMADDTDDIIIISDDMLDTEKDLRRCRMREFYQLTHILFTKPERLILYKVLKDYRRRRDVERLVLGLKLILRTYTKLELLKYVRYFIWEGHLKDFERLTQFHTLFRRRRKERKLHHHSLDHLSVASATTTSSGRHFKDVRVFTLRKEPGEASLGFSVRGGSEHGLGIFVSEIDVESVAEKSGLKVGDKILEANNISMKGAASSSAVKVLTGSSRLKLVIQRTKKVPEWRLSREKTSWYDVHEQRLITGEFEECGISHHIRGLDADVPERRVNLKFARTDKTLGFNIRGGREYGLGIYVSKMDRGGMADENGVHVDDQIIDVNGIPFENITHAHAVEVLKGKAHLILTLRDVGRFPVCKELYAEYTWSDGQLRPASSVTNVKDIYVDETAMGNRTRSVSDIFSTKKRPSALQSEIFLPTQRLGHDLAGSRERFNDEMMDDDGDSLINLEQWAQEIKDTGDDNHGYVSDSELDNNVIVYVQDFDAESSDADNGLPDIYSDITHEHHGNGLADARDFGDEEDDEHNYAAADMIYAKINKTDQRSETESNFSFNSKVKSDSTVLNISRSGHDTRVHSTDVKEHRMVNSVQASVYKTEHKQSSENGATEAEAVETASIDGALYSQVKRLSVGPAPQAFQAYVTPSTSSQDMNAEQSLEDTYNHHQHNHDQTLQIRKFKKHSSDNSDNSDDEGMRINRTYQKYTMQQREAMDDSENEYDLLDAQKAYKASEETGRNDGDDENFSLNELQVRLKELEKRQANIGMRELNTLATDQREVGPDGSPSHKKGKWKSLKSKIKGSLRIKSSKSSGFSIKSEDAASRGSVKNRGLFARSFGSDITQPNTIDGYNMASLEDKARKMLNTDEFEAVMRHVKTYHESHELERFVELLLVILDKPEKLLLLRDIRGVIYPLDMVQFDNTVNHYEIEAYQKLSLKLHLPLNHKPQRKPRKTLITTEIAEDGHFHIKPMRHYEQQREVIDVLQEEVSQSKSRHRSPLHKQKFLDESNVMNQFDYLDHEHDHSDAGSSVAAVSEFGSHGSSELDRIPGAIIVHLSKNKPTLGIDFIEKDVNGQKEVIVDRIDPRGAANDDSTLEVGMTLLGVDRYKVGGCTVEETLAVLQKSYSDKQFVSMKLVLHKPQSTDL